MVLCVSLCICLFSCSSENEVSEVDESYDKGIERGEKNIFVSLYNASRDAESIEILCHGEIWETDCFVLTFTDRETTEAPILECELTLKNFTIDEGMKENLIYFGLYSQPIDGRWNKIVSDYSDYYMWAILEDDYSWGDYTSKTDFKLEYDQMVVVAIIVIEGELYTAGYLLNTNN